MRCARSSSAASNAASVPAGTGSGTSGPAVRAIWEALYGITPGGLDIDPSQAAIDGTTPPSGLPTFMDDGSILPPARKE